LVGNRELAEEGARYTYLATQPLKKILEPLRRATKEAPWRNQELSGNNLTHVENCASAAEETTTSRLGTVYPCHMPGGTRCESDKTPNSIP